MHENWVRYYDRPKDAREHRASNGSEHFVAFSVDGVDLRFSVKDPMSRWRVKTLFIKEPSTLFWFGALPRGEVFFDIGANVGLYAIYATLLSGVRTYAFEPESQNFGVSMRTSI